MATAVLQQPITRVGIGGPISEELLARAYFELERQGQLGLIFWDYYPKPLSLREWLDWHQKIVYRSCWAYPTLDSEPQLAGLGWISQIKDVPGYRRGEIGMCFFKRFEFSRTRDGFSLAEKLTRLLIDFCFSPEGANLDYIWGVSPEQNRLANRFARRLGFKQVTVPGYVLYYGQPANAVISTMSRTQPSAQGGA